MEANTGKQSIQTMMSKLPRMRLSKLFSNERHDLACLEFGRISQILADPIASRNHIFDNLTSSTSSNKPQASIKIQSKEY